MNDHSKAGDAPPKDAKANDSPERSDRGRARVGRGAIIRWTITAACVLLIVGLRSYRPIGDAAVTNIFTLILSFVVFLTWWIWFTFRSPFGRACRWGVNGALVAGLVAVPLLIEVTGVSGDLIPTWKWRLAGSAAPATTVDEDATAKAPQVIVAESEQPATTEDDFPQFLGPQRLNWVDGSGLRDDWSEQTPEIMWKQSIGEGWSGFAAVNGLAYTLEQAGPEELVTCYQIEDGQRIWSHAIEGRHHTFLGQTGPRSVPTVNEGRVFAMGATGVLRCLNAIDGELLWSRNIPQEVGSNPEQDAQAVSWGRANSPLVVDDMVIIPGGGPPSGPHVSLLAFDKSTGEPIWQGGARQISYSSPIVTELAGKRQIVVLNESTVTGHDLKTGEELWVFHWPGTSNADANCSQPVPVGDDRLLVSKGYSQGAAVFEVTRRDGKFETSPVWEDRTVLKTKFTNVVVYDGHAYGLSDGMLQCVRILDGASQWRQPRRDRFKHGQVVGVGDKLLAVTEDGELAMVHMTPERYDERGRVPVLDGQTWNNLCLYGPLVLMRNAQQAACVKLP